MSKSDKVTKGPIVEKESVEQLISRAMNEHGFLFQSRLLQLFGSKVPWKVVATEVPVASVVTGEETRIDMVIERAGPLVGAPWQGVIEAKRSHPDYKYWVFFDESPRLANQRESILYIQSTKPGNDGRGGITSEKHNMGIPKPSDLRVFNYYLEAKETFSGKGTRSATNSTIEEALGQVALGSIGLATKLEKLRKNFHRMLPIVVTTAKLFAANYKTDEVTLDRGEITPEKLSLDSLDWACVNYAIGDKLANSAHLTTNSGANLAEEMSLRSLRSVFVVQSTKLLEFLRWFNEELVDRNPT